VRKNLITGLPAALHEAQSAGIKITQRAILNIFAPQGQHATLTEKKLGMQEWTEGPVL